ncbi:MAG: hypothetical protein M3Z30_07150, partial [Gemmatimonadota bacterium]|nr:hypothetical protein [Gemmatimonadota bacterium]
MNVRSSCRFHMGQRVVSRAALILATAALYAVVSLGAATASAQVKHPVQDSATRLTDFISPGISRELAEYRSAHLRDVRYDLALDVTGRDTADG